MATATARKPRAKKKPAKTGKAAPVVALPALPPVGIARFTEASRLLETLLREKTQVFVTSIAHYAETRRTATARPLNHTESLYAASVLAKELGEDPVKFAEQVQASELRGSDQPGELEMLLAAGLATAPEFIDAAMNFVALIEMPADQFKTARKSGGLREEIKAAAEAILDADPEIELLEMRLRATAALEHFARAGGEDPGKAVGLLREMIGRALTTAMEQARSDRSGLSLSIDSPPPTGGDLTS